MRSRRWGITVSLGLVTVATLLSFFSSLDNDFVNWDDEIYVTKNYLIRDLSWNSVKEIFFSPLVKHYVPLVPLSFSLEYALWGLNPFGYHLTNILLHLCNSLLVFALVLRLSGHLIPALVAALFFGVHPLHVESVAWVSERKDVLSTLFFLGALLCYLRYRERRRAVFYALSFVAFVLALLAKPMAITLPLIMFLCDFLSRRAWTTRTVLEKVPFLVVSAFFSVVAILINQSAGDPRVLHFPAPEDNLLIACWALVFYLGKTLAPVQLSAFYPYPAEISLWLPVFFLPPILLLALASGIWISRRYTRKVVFGSLFFFLTLLPVLNIVPFSGAAVADRYMYIPSIGLFYLAGMAFQRIYAWKIHWEKAKNFSLMVLLVVTVIVLGRLTWQQSNIWQDSKTLWLSVLENYPGVPHAHNNLGNVYLGEGKLDAAIAEYREAISHYPTYTLAHFNLGNVYLKKGKLDSAASEYKKVISLDPTAALAHFNLGKVYLKKEDLEAAIAEYLKAILLNPKDAIAHNDLGKVYLKKGNLDAAIAEYQKAISLNPTYDLAHYNLGVVYERKGELDVAIAEYQKAISLNPTAGTHYNLGNIYLKTGQLDAAASEYKKAISLNPDDASLYNNLGAAYLRKGRLDSAIAEYQKTISLNPDDALAHYNLANVFLRKGRLDFAVSEYKKAISLNPKEARLYNNLGATYLKQGKLGAAIAEYKKAISLNPDDASLYNNLGAAYLRKGRLDAAIVEYKKAISLNPRRKPFYYKLASALYVQGRYEESFSVLEKVLSLFPEDGTATEMLREYRKAGLPIIKK